MIFFYDTRTGFFGDPPLEFRGLIDIPGRDQVDPMNQRVDLATGEVVDYQPPAPADTVDAVWSWATSSRLWIPVPTLVYEKRMQAQRIKAAAKAEDQTDITISGNVLAADFASRATLYQKVMIAQLAAQDGQPFSVDWQLADDTVVTLNANQVKAIVRAINTREDAIRTKAHTLLAAIKSATTTEEVLAITWAFP